MLRFEHLKLPKSLFRCTFRRRCRPACLSLVNGVGKIMLESFPSNMSPDFCPIECKPDRLYLVCKQLKKALASSRMVERRDTKSCSNVTRIKSRKVPPTISLEIKWSLRLPCCNRWESLTIAGKDDTLVAYGASMAFCLCLLVAQ